jgi:hypothetical protein
MGEFIHSWAAGEGRFYGVFGLGPIWVLDLIRNPWLFNAARLGLDATALWLFGRLVLSVTRSADLVLLWALIWIGCLQIPPTFYGLLSYPQMSCGLIFILLASLEFWRSVASRPEACPWTAGILFFLGVLFNEAFGVFVLLFPTLLAWRSAQGVPRASWRTLVPTTLAAVLYLAVYFGYRVTHVHPIYGGTQIGFDLRGAAEYLFRYGASSLPAFELVIDRNVHHPAFASVREVAARLSGANLWRVPWALAVGAGCARILANVRWPWPGRRTAAFAVAASMAGILFLGVPMVSIKYQIFAHLRQYPHAYNFVAVDFFWLSASAACLGLVSALAPGSASRKSAACGLGLAFAAICMTAQITNPIALDEIRVIVRAPP